MKNRAFEITCRDSDNKYTIKVDGKPATVKWNKVVFDDLEKSYHGVNVDEEVITMIIHELDLEFNLTENEIQEYTKTLKYILED